MRKEKILGFDLIRALCATGIVLYHFSFNFIEYQISGSHLFFARFANGDWGNMFVAMFFMLSGALLWYNHGEHFNVPRFYLKRWLSIFPMFYIAWAVAYYIKVTQEMGGNWLYAGPRSKFLYTIFGMDGYFMQLDPNKPGFNLTYYTLGEWFLGAIVMLYLVFPIMVLLFRRYKRTGVFFRFLVTALLLVAFFANVKYNYWNMPAGKNMITCSLDFWAGMLIMEYYGKKSVQPDSGKMKRNVFIVCAILTAVAVFIPLGFDISEHMVVQSLFVGSILFIFLLQVGEYIMKKKIPAFIVKYISKWSFGIFLVHHVFIYGIMKPYMSGDMSLDMSVGMFLVVFAATVAVGGILSEVGAVITKFVLKLIDRITALFAKNKNSVN